MRIIALDKPEHSECGCGASHMEITHKIEHFHSGKWQPMGSTTSLKAAEEMVESTEKYFKTIRELGKKC